MYGPPGPASAIVAPRGCSPEGLAEGDRAREADVKFKVIAVIASATALSVEASDPLTGLARYERTRRPRASRVVLAARERGLSNHLPSRRAAWRRDLLIAWRRRVNRHDPEGRGTAWLADYDASSSDVLAA